MTGCVHFDEFEDGTVCCCRGGRCTDVTPGMCESCRHREGGDGEPEK